MQVLQEEWDDGFSPSSYGFRPNRSAHQAIAKAQEHTRQGYSFVVDIDLEKFFDNLDHELMMRAVRKHTQCRWVLLYIQRWLKAPLQKADGTLEKREKGTPQGGVCSPFLTNIFMHHAFDEWMRWHYPAVAFERYADDVLVHCKTEQQAERMRIEIEKRLAQCKLQLHPEKTHIVYCKDEDRRKEYPMITVDFLGYRFQPRMARNKHGKFFVSFLPAVSTKARIKFVKRYGDGDFIGWEGHR